MSDDIAIKVENLSKLYKLYASPLDRLKESINPFSKTYHNDFYALNNVSFDVKQGETIGIIGKNGSGKSTLLKLISGVLTPTSGSVVVNGKVSALLELGAGFNPEMTGIENVFFNGTLMGYTREEMEVKLDPILSFADIGEFAKQPVKTYSSGMFVRLAFSVATIIDPCVLIIDEALSVGDVFFQQKCYARLKELKSNGVTILFVTHSMGDVVQYCQRALMLNDNRLEYVGEAAEAVKRYLLVQQQERLAAFAENASQNQSGFPAALPPSSDFFWPQAHHFLDVSEMDEVTTGMAHCTAIAICNQNGVASRLFAQNDLASIYCEFEVDGTIEVPIGGFIIKNQQNIMVHGKNTLYYDELLLPACIPPRGKIRFRFDVSLDIAPGDYTLDIGLSTLRKSDYDERDYTPLAHIQSRALRLCHLSGVASFSVLQKPQLREYGLQHAGVCNLRGHCSVALLHQSDTPSMKEGSNTNMPTIFHVTHWKAGSQWIKKILKELFPEMYVESQVGVAHFLKEPIQKGMVYPTVYVTKEQFDSVDLPGSWRRFIVIRDLRDTLVSGYFSLKVSHSMISTGIATFRDKLNDMNVEDGLLYLIDEWLYLSADIQKSWLDSGEVLIKYEDFLDHDIDIFSDILIGQCQLPVSRDELERAVINNRFERLTGGRKSGTEDISSHERKGIAGDWKNYFTPKVKEYFKVKYGELLVSTGYEQGNDW